MSACLRGSSRARLHWLRLGRPRNITVVSTSLEEEPLLFARLMLAGPAGRRKDVARAGPAALVTYEHRMPLSWMIKLTPTTLV